MSNVEDDFVEASKFVREKILHILKNYPKLSHSMLQVGLGTSLPPKVWHPVLERLKEEGRVKVIIIQDASPSGRDQTYHIISLVTTTAAE